MIYLLELIWGGIGLVIVYFLKTNPAFKFFVFAWVFVPTLLALLSCSKIKKSPKEKTLWLIVIILIPVFGPMGWFEQKRRDERL